MSVPTVAVEDLEGVIAFAIERNLPSWEQVPQWSRWNIKDTGVGWQLHPAVAASEPLNWKVATARE